MADGDEQQVLGDQTQEESRQQRFKAWKDVGRDFFEVCLRARVRCRWVGYGLKHHIFKINPFIRGGTK